jgi:hypothetical protein
VESARRDGKLPRLATRVACVGFLASALLLSSLVAAAGGRRVPGERGLTSARGIPPLVFGIYPGGAAGTVGPGGVTVPPDPAKQLAALQRLRPAGRPFVLHLYASFSGFDSAPASDQVGAEIAAYTSSGFQVELVLTYRPTAGDSAANVARFADFARAAVRSFGPNPDFVGLQVTNEANIDNGPNVADGYNSGATDALVQGVVAAKAEARKDRFDHVGIGFNWAYSTNRGEAGFWRTLGRGGPEFTKSVDWVGLDVYPATWGPRTTGSDLAATARKTMLTSLATLRRFMRIAGLGPAVALHVSENGYPTGPGRTNAMQVEVMKAAIDAVNAARAVYSITDYRWFDLRDADSSSPSFESQYGLLRDDYTPKPAFAEFHELVADLSRP